MEEGVMGMRRFLLVILSCFVGFAGVLYFGTDFAEEEITPNEQVDQIDREIKQMKDLQNRYRAAARRFEDEGMRFQFQADMQQEAKRAYKKAELAKEKVKDLQAQIDALNEKKAEILRESPTE